MNYYDFLVKKEAPEEDRERTLMDFRFMRTENTGLTKKERDILSLYAPKKNQNIFKRFINWMTR